MLNKKGIGALLLIGMVMMGTGSTISAQEKQDVPMIGNGTGENPASVSITKELEMAEGLAVPDVTFSFTAEKDSPQDAPKAVITPISYKSSDERGEALEGKYTISKNSAVTFEEFPHAGEYTYTIKETKESADGITYSTEQYTLRVQVANKQGGGVYVKNVTAEKGTDDGITANKVNEILFTNIYRKNASLVIEKKTTGELADKTKQFRFTISFIKSPTEDKLEDFTGTITRKGNTTEEVKSSDGRASFTLADGDKLVFDDLPAGTKYTVTEKGVKDGYVPQVQVTENGVQGEVKKGTDGEDLESFGTGNYIGEKENKVVFENIYHEVPITGIVMNNLPFILLIGIAVMAFCALAVLKKRRGSRR